MADFILATFGQEEIKKRSIAGLMRSVGFYRSRLVMGLFFRAKRELLNSRIRKVELCDSLSVWLVKLPFSAAGLKWYNLRSLDGYLLKILAETGAKSCLLPSDTCEGTGLEHFAAKAYLGGTIFKALLPSVLKGICKRSGKVMADLDMVIIPGENADELSAIVSILEPEIKYVTIAAPAGIESLEDRLGEISEESGLSISISSDYKSVFRHADIIINLAVVSPVSEYRLPSKALVLNLNDSCRLKTRSENIVISGTQYELPQKLKDQLGQDTLECFGGREAADIVIRHKLDIPEGCGFSEGIGQLLRKEYRDGGFLMTGFTGARGVIRTDSILI